MHVLSRCVFSGIVTRFRLTALISCGSLYCIPACLQNSNSVRCNQRPRFNLIWPILYSLTYCIWRNLKPFILIHSLALSRERFSLITGSHNIKYLSIWVDTKTQTSLKQHFTEPQCLFMFWHWHTIRCILWKVFYIPHK